MAREARARHLWRPCTHDRTACSDSAMASASLIDVADSISVGDGYNPLWTMPGASFVLSSSEPLLDRPILSLDTLQHFTPAGLAEADHLVLPGPGATIAHDRTNRAKSSRSYLAIARRTAGSK